MAEFDENPKERVHTADAVMLPALIAHYCGEDGNRRTLATFEARKKTLDRLRGPGAFREEAATFIAECEAGEEPNNRAAAFNARLTRAVEAATAEKPP